MSKSMLYVDFNEMLEPDLVLLSATNDKADINGNKVLLSEGLQVIVYMDDMDDKGNPDNLIAVGVVERNHSSGWSSHVKWCCRIDNDGIRHMSEIRKI
ncbi:hypothetical protein [Aquirhabdus parva]|uniref:Uncharacterized protein n=1 Tax=Aquirhabdus parva TaxID=2283318 RepID=A0A345P9S0_9GAMM|nr:hypothetical protein [Aquirhabdus parva]AXI04029.1 hypothetical protein HYN46_14965 [Aquirhabdus parva]